MAKGEQPGKKDAGGGIARFFMKNVSSATPPTNSKAKTKRQPKKSKSSDNIARGSIDKFFIKKAPAVDKAADLTARRKLQYDSPPTPQRHQPKRKKIKSNVQAPIGQFLKSADVGQRTRPNFLEQDFPDPASMPADHRVTEIQFQRDALSVAPAIRRPIRLPLNDEQRRVAECPPDIPLSVRAGAGSGKTHTMVQRAVNLVNHYDLSPESILMITFSNKAAEELKERIAASFAGDNFPGKDIRLPTIKTFHSLAYSWICRCWRACELGKRPSPLATKSQKRGLMRRAIDENLDQLRLERCKQMLWGSGEPPREVNWEVVLEVFRSRHVDDYDAAYLKADLAAFEKMPDDNTKRTLTVEELQILNEEVKGTRKLYLRLECYLEMLRRKTSKSTVTCDLKRRWSGNLQQCDLYLELVRKARLGRHSKRDYLREDARVWELYDKLQRETGQVDFDSMLILFTDQILGNERLAERFHAMYTHVIVDEYQDNSEAQALMLNKIVEHGSLTVVGDDDQCIYQFRGASPGNFGRLRQYFSEERQINVREETLTENYRSSANILAVADTFLRGDMSRHPKILRPTRPTGSSVEIWKCRFAKGQMRHIVAAMIERHETEGVEYGDMACLFCCFKTTLGPLTIHLQTELAHRNVPFNVVGGKSIFEREAVLNLLAYLRLSVTGSADDDSFERVINKPPRRLPKDKLLPLIRQVKRNNVKAATTSLQEAAVVMCQTGFGLSPSQHKALKEFLAQIDQLRKEVNDKPLPDLLKHLWKKTGLEEFHRNKNSPKEKDGKGKASDDETNESSDEIDPEISTHASKTGKTAAPYNPLEIDSLTKMATRHVQDWEQREKEVITLTHRSKNDKLQKVPSLVELSRNVIMLNRISIEIEMLPEHILDDIILAPCALGRSVIREFLACAALSSGNEEPSPSNDKIGKVSISTIHRAKGLEWGDVYVPFFNQGFMPMNARSGDDDDTKGQGRRHLPNCSAMHGDRCDKSCARVFEEMDAERLGATEEERHMNEERRLAHVAATRAKNKLVFTMFERDARSEFEGELSQLSDSVLQIVRKD